MFLFLSTKFCLGERLPFSTKEQIIMWVVLLLVMSCNIDK